MSPRIDPQFHIYEIEAGAGSSTSVDDIVLRTGWVLWIFTFIS